MNVLQTIFTDHYEEMLYILHPRDSVIENVDTIFLAQGNMSALFYGYGSMPISFIHLFIIRHQGYKFLNDSIEQASYSIYKNDGQQHFFCK